MFFAAQKKHEKSRNVSFAVTIQSNYKESIKNKNDLHKIRLSHKKMKTENDVENNIKNKKIFFKKYSTPKIKYFHRKKSISLSQTCFNHINTIKLKKNLEIVRKSNYFKKKKPKMILKNENQNEKNYDKEMIKYIKTKLGYEQNYSTEKMMFNENVNYYVNKYMEDFIYKKPKEIEIKLKKSFTIFLNENLPVILYYNIIDKNEIKRIEISFLKRVKYEI